MDFSTCYSGTAVMLSALITHLDARAEFLGEELLRSAHDYGVTGAHSVNCLPHNPAAIDRVGSIYPNANVSTLLRLPSRRC